MAACPSTAQSLEHTYYERFGAKAPSAEIKKLHGFLHHSRYVLQFCHIGLPGDILSAPFKEKPRERSWEYGAAQVRKTFLQFPEAPESSDEEIWTLRKATSAPEARRHEIA